MTAKLLLDFGASRIKAAIYNPEVGRIEGVLECAAPVPEFGPAGEVEVEPSLYNAALQHLLSNLPVSGANIDSAYLCVEMHGFILVDDMNRALTRYISWRDTRSTHGARALLPRIDEAEREEFKSRTGMKLRSGLPVLTVAAMAERGDLPEACRLLSLAEWLAVCGGAPTGLVHETLAAASGLYDLQAQTWDPSLYMLVGGSACPQIRLNTVFDDVRQPVGYLTVANRRVPLFGGIGDMQAAFLGSGCGDTEACVNLGTGSQVITLAPAYPSRHTERRPLMSGRRLATLSHIPSGRAINVFSNLIDDIASASGGEPGILWKLLRAVTVEQVISSRLSVDLNVFDAAWRFRGGGGVSGVVEGHFTLLELVSSLVRSFAEQYRDAVAALDPEHRLTRLVLAGGVSRRIPVLAPTLTRLTGTLTAASHSAEETLDGLAELSHQ